MADYSRDYDDTPPNPYAANPRLPLELKNTRDRTGTGLKAVEYAVEYDYKNRYDPPKLNEPATADLEPVRDLLPAHAARRGVDGVREYVEHERDFHQGRNTPKIVSRVVLYGPWEEV